MEAGKLRQRVTVQSPTGTQDAVGERTTTWSDVAEVWASVEPITAREQFLAGQMQASTTHRIRLRYAAALAAMDGSWRVLLGARVFVLTGPPRNIDERNREWELLAVEGLREE
jgi:SPP1 family predicted phage head-tail adaptor